MDEALISRITKELAPIAGRSTVEFGLLPCRKGVDEQRVIVIDLISQDEPLRIGVDADFDSLSAGKITGAVLKPELEASFDSHMQDIFTGKSAFELPKKPVVIIAELPTLSLVPLLSGRSGQDIAFVFTAGSFLCHFAILLRERGIPAIISASAADSLQVGDMVEISVDSRHGSFRKHVVDEKIVGTRP